MGFVIAHFRKIKTDAGLANLAAHNTREKYFKIDGNEKWTPKGPLPDWMTRPELIKRNCGDGERSSEGVLRRRNDIIVAAKLARKPQKNAAAAIEAVFTASPDTFGKVVEGVDKRDLTKWKAYLLKCLDWTYEKFGKENVLQWNMHFDEATPHLHVLLVPIVRTVNENRYSSSTFLGGRIGLKKIHTELANKVGKEYGLRRGQEESEARHTDQAQWIREVRKTERSIENREKEIAKKETELAKREKVLNKEAEELNAAMGDIKAMKAEAESELKTAKTEAKRIIEAAMKKVQGIVQGVKQFVNLIRQEVEKLEGGKKVLAWADTYIKTYEQPPRPASKTPPKTHEEGRSTAR